MYISGVLTKAREENASRAFFFVFLSFLLDTGQVTQ